MVVRQSVTVSSGGIENTQAAIAGCNSGYNNVISWDSSGVTPA